MKKPCAIFLLLFALLAMSNLFLIEEEDSAQALRCEMFQMWADSNGQYGWPEESNPTAAKQCNQSEVTSK
jgi:hypothetical protein